MHGEIKMIIGVDADGVLTDMQEFNYQCGKKHFKKEIENPEGYSVKEIFNVGKIAELFYGLRYFPKYCKEYPPRENAVAVIQKLRLDGHGLHEITARKFVTYKNFIGSGSRKWFVEWCKNNELIFSSITFCSEKNGPEEKYSACKQLGVDIMIDDRPEIVMYLAERGVPVLMMDAPYNQSVKHENITRVFGWQDVYEKINCILK